MTEPPFNKLTPAEAERLAMLAEEAGEIVQAVGKILRHGYESYHPDDLVPVADGYKVSYAPAMGSLNNRALLENEIADFHAVQLMMEERGDIADLSPQASDAVGHAMEKKLRFVHHQHTKRTPDAKA